MSYLGSDIHKSAVVKGGKKRAEQLSQLKEKNIELYNQSPSICLGCQLPIDYTRRKNKFCSSSCAAKVSNKGRVVSELHKQRVAKSLMSPRITRYCPTCNKEFTCKVSSKKIYCCSKCYLITPEGKYKAAMGGRVGGKISSIKLLRRSKNEMLFADKCKEIFCNVLENIPMFDGWDADVILPSAKIAILWNGNWHRKKICNGHSVKQVQTRDKIKLEKIREYGYIPYVIDDYGKHNPEFVQQEFEKFLSYVKAL